MYVRVLSLIPEDGRKGKMVLFPVPIILGLGLLSESFTLQNEISRPQKNKIRIVIFFPFCPFVNVTFYFQKYFVSTPKNKNKSKI